MNYMITRDGQEYGPYTLGDLQRYVASGEVLLTDMARSEGMTDALPVSQVIGTIPAPVPAKPVSLAPAGPVYPDPPNLHWALVLLFSFLTCGMFLAAWGIVQAVFVRKLYPNSRAIYYYAVYAGSLLLIFTMSFIAATRHTSDPLVGLVNLFAWGFSLGGRYSIKYSLEEHYNSDEPMGVLLSGVMVFFFGEIYIQYHLNDIVRRKKLDRLDALSV